MAQTLNALIERRNQIKALIEENFQKNKADIDARFPDLSFMEKYQLMNAPDNLLNNRNNALKEVLADLDAQIEDAKKELPKAQWKITLSKLNGSFADTAQHMISTLKVQIFPSTECAEPNDAFIKGLFRFGPKSFKKALQGTKFGVFEKKETKRKDAVFSQLALQNSEGYEDDNPLSEFDRDVLGVIISEYLSGNRYTTVNIIHRALIGKVGEVGIYPFKNQQEAIINSVVKLMATIVDFSSVSESLKEMNYTDQNGNTVVLKTSNLLLADVVDAKINGQVMDNVIFFKANSPLFDIANAKSQVIRYPHVLLDVPNQNNTPRIITLKKYVMRRICEIKLHKNMTPTITFDDVFQKCRMLNCPREVKRDARNAIANLFQHLKDKNFISDFEIVQQRNKFISVKFTF